jgi:hypothetical protein
MSERRAFGCYVEWGAPPSVKCDCLHGALDCQIPSMEFEPLNLMQCF